MPRSAHDGFSLDLPLSRLRGIGAKRAGALAEMGLVRVMDLLLHLPRRYEELLPARPIAELQPDTHAAVQGRVAAVHTRRRGRRALTRVRVQQAAEAIEVLFFNQAYLQRTLARGRRLWVQGRVEQGPKEVYLVALRHELLPEAGALPAARPLPVYELPPGLPARLHRGLLEELLDTALLELGDWRRESGLPADGLLGLERALRILHRPAAGDDLAAARRRMAYEELLGVVLPFLRLRRRGHTGPKPVQVRVGPEEADRLLGALPYAPTPAQGRAARAVLADLAEGRPMHRLLHGEVGSGKTAVALVALAAVARSGHLGVLLCPTHLLAAQQESAARAYLQPLGVRTALCTGSLGAAERQRRVAEVAGGGVLIGTHSMLSETIPLPGLRLVVIDEQHRFGVMQRAGLRGKGDQVDLLVMSATPIPRSLALALYGDLDVTLLDQLPPGRAPVATRVVAQGDLDLLVDEVLAEARSGGRVFVVCPRVQDDGGGTVVAAKVVAARMTEAFAGEARVALVHGGRRAEVNERELVAFRAGAAPVLVATTMVEVGIDVPEASLMVVINAERFGLAALHQLRGRVGRGAPGARCLLAHAGGERARARLEILAGSNDGLAIAEADLRLRGPGAVGGVRQHGGVDLRHADLLRDLDLLERAREDAQRLLERALDPPALPLEWRLDDPGPG